MRVALDALEREFHMRLDVLGGEGGNEVGGGEDQHQLVVGISEQVEVDANRQAKQDGYGEAGHGRLPWGCWFAQ